ncbi:hypothetical protein DOTSEDRAFT_173406 [Dothistroma septosporum NZE10]|uniref:Trafficking protein particle complex subunit 6B n=1 Tax=Dothistroma septosporum (strain NZE10 / CBS 128990) TaxID=675120 RepID=M2YLM3_DOTSN|nr:hypothetical protein DOTSEDRAFT_173406 [Dothistroma septosporum NZE10]
MSRAPAAQVDIEDLNNPKLNVSCLDFLLIELVPLAQRITDQLHAREQALVDEFKSTNSVKDSSFVGGMGSTALGTATVMDDETREAVFWRLDGLGYRVGQGLVERFSAGKPRPTTPLEAIKFICKDLWQLLFRKQIDNLKTNHRGVFVLTDSRFQPLSRMSVDRRAGPKAAEDALRRAQTFLYFPCGVIRGALQGLGIDVTITAETTEIPTATFQIKTKGAKA